LEGDSLRISQRRVFSRRWREYFSGNFPSLSFEDSAMFVRSCFLSTLLCLSGLCSASGAVISVTATDSYLDNVGNLTNFATVIDLSTISLAPGQLGVAPGALVSLEALGEFSVNGPETDPAAGLDSGMIAVFSSSDTLLPVDAFNPRLRVVDAIEAGSDIDTNAASGFGPNIDITQDFLINNTILEVPVGATHLFVSPLDGFVGDNQDTDGDFMLQITAVPEPGSFLLLAVGLVSLPLRRQRRKLCA